MKKAALSYILIAIISGILSFLFGDRDIKMPNYGFAQIGTLVSILLLFVVFAVKKLLSKGITITFILFFLIMCGGTAAPYLEDRVEGPVGLIGILFAIVNIFLGIFIYRRIDKAKVQV